MQLAIVLYPGLTALDAVGPYEVLRLLADAEVRFVAAAPGPVAWRRALNGFRARAATRATKGVHR
jgi:putative intracellular protease/amidase